MFSDIGEGFLHDTIKYCLDLNGQTTIFHAASRDRLP
jgi:hypothetical protein